MILASNSMTDPSPLVVASLLGAVFFLVAGINAVLKLVDRLKDKPSPGEVQRETSERYATKRDFEKHMEHYHKDRETTDRRIDGLDRTLKKHIDEKVQGLQASAEAGRENLRSEINSVGSEINSVGLKVAGLEKETANQNAWLSRIDDKLDQLKS